MSTIFFTFKKGPYKSILSQTVNFFGITFVSLAVSVFRVSVINLFSSGILKSYILVAKLKLLFLKLFKLSVNNIVYICKQLSPEIAAVVDAIAGIIFPETSFSFKKSVFSIL